MLKWINKKRNKKGFTLVELVVVIAILGILAAIAVPRLSGSRDNANKKAVEANMRVIDSAISIAEADGKLDDNPTIDELVTLQYIKAAPSTSGVTYAISASKPFRAIVSIPANTFGTHAVVTNADYEALQAITNWK